MLFVFTVKGWDTHEWNPGGEPCTVGGRRSVRLHCWQYWRVGEGRDHCHCHWWVINCEKNFLLYRKYSCITASYDNQISKLSCALYRIFFYLFLFFSNSGETSKLLGRTVGVAVGGASSYIALVGAMLIYCRQRRQRLKHSPHQTTAGDPLYPCWQKWLHIGIHLRCWF